MTLLKINSLCPELPCVGLQSPKWTTESLKKMFGMHFLLTEMIYSYEFTNVKSITKIHQDYYKHIGKCLPDVSRDMEEQQKINATYCAAFKIAQDDYNIGMCLIVIIPMRPTLFVCIRSCCANKLFCL